MKIIKTTNPSDLNQPDTEVGEMNDMETEEIVNQLSRAFSRFADDKPVKINRDTIWGEISQFRERQLSVEDQAKQD